MPKTRFFVSRIDALEVPAGSRNKPQGCRPLEISRIMRAPAEQRPSAAPARRPWHLAVAHDAWRYYVKLPFKAPVRETATEGRTVGLIGA